MEGAGLSPRTRGILELFLFQIPIRGSIPAHAGNPSQTKTSTILYTVYPRARGESEESRNVLFCAPGLSPRTRGILFRSAFDAPLLGSIPAHAGNPRWPQNRHWPRWVYPRARGESMMRSVIVCAMSGLSPRTRGIHTVLDGRV